MGLFIDSITKKIASVLVTSGALSARIENPGELAGGDMVLGVTRSAAVAQRVALSATGIARPGVALYYGIQCLTAGTVELRAGTAAGDPLLRASGAMTAGQVEHFSGMGMEVTGIYAVVTSGTYVLLLGD